MSGIRYEEYGVSNDGIPFVLYDGLHRTPLTCSSAANWHDHIEVQLCHSGEGFVLIDGERRPFLPDDIVLVNSGAIHYTGTEHELLYSSLLIDPVFCRCAGFEPTALFFEPCFRDSVCFSLCRDLIELYHNESAPHRCAGLQILILQLLIHLTDLHTVPAPEVKGVPAHDTVKRAIRYIRENYHQKITLDSLAAVVYTDKYNLTRIFRRLTQLTVVDYINQYRCRMAMSMIADGKSISEAAAACGFHNMSFFTKTFRRHIGCLPSDCKRRGARGM
ncbi:MAG: helix-turn-helix domain-containing protein [Clostridia bacterium]|nr:helix-turn-helix domain-containing protein [Clostridia bacterium]